MCLRAQRAPSFHIWTHQKWQVVRFAHIWVYHIWKEGARCARIHTKKTLRHALRTKNHNMSSLYTDEFTTDREGVHDMLLCHGVAVIPGVMSEKECADASLNLWGEFETVFQAYPTPLSRRDPSTWKQCLLSLRPHHRMLFQSVICHSQTVWDVRQNYEIFKIFQSIYDCKCRMLVSFDGLSFLPAPERGGYGFSDGEQRWFHVDQSLKTHGFKCVQGFVTLQPVDEGDATLGVVAGSHMLHDKFLQEHHGWLPKSRKLMNADELKHDTKLDKGLVSLQRAGAGVLQDSSL